MFIGSMGSPDYICEKVIFGVLFFGGLGVWATFKKVALRNGFSII